MHLRHVQQTWVQGLGRLRLRVCCPTGAPAHQSESASVYVKANAGALKLHTRGELVKWLLSLQGALHGFRAEQLTSNSK
jgi:hypothetical protein